MRSSKAKFKFALRSVSRGEKIIQADAMASNLLNSEYASFRKDVRKLERCKPIQFNIIHGISGESNITSFWKSHFL